jgi:ribosome-binding factor A
VYLSLLNAPNKEELMNVIRMQGKDIRHELATRIRKQVRIIPELHFLLDDSLDYVFHMEKVFENLKKKEDPEQG